MVGPLIPTYNRIEPASVGGMQLLSCRCHRSGSRSTRCRTTPIGSWAPSIALPLQSGVETVDQSAAGGALRQKTGCSRLQSSRARVLDRESRDENERHPVSLGEQVGL